MTPRPDIEFSFPELSASEAGNAADFLEQAINDATRSHGENAIASRRRTDDRAADLGTVVSIVLGAPATIILTRGIAQAIRAYFGRTNRASLEITRPDGTRITLTDAESRDVAKVADKLRKFASNDDRAKGSP